MDDARLPLLGRDEESATVRQALEDALAGAGGVITVDGATGMGKSRLVADSLDASASATGGRRIVSGLNRTVRRAPTGCCATRYGPLLGVTRAEPQVMGRALLGSLQRWAPDLLPMASLLADVVQVEVPSTPGVRPDRPAVPRRPDG